MKTASLYPRHEEIEKTTKIVLIIKRNNLFLIALIYVLFYL